MNIAEIRNNYPQYADLSDEKIAQGMHQKFYPDMAFEDFSNKIGYSSVSSPSDTFQPSAEALEQVTANNKNYESKYNNQLKPLLGRNINDIEQEQHLGQGSGFLSGLKAMKGEDWADVSGQSLQGVERVADGATLGAYDWANRKMGGNYQERKDRLQRQADTAGIGGLNAISGLGLELGGNIAGAGGLLYKGLSKGVKGAGKLAALSGGLEGAAYGATGSDTWDETKNNMLSGVLTGTVLGGVGLMERISEDVKVLSSASVSVFLDYAQIFNTVVTLLISVCTLVYVANRAYQVIRDIWRGHEK